MRLVCETTLTSSSVTLLFLLLPFIGGEGEVLLALLCMIRSVTASDSDYLERLPCSLCCVAFLLKSGFHTGSSRYGQRRPGRAMDEQSGWLRPARRYIRCLLQRGG
eukprot:COSAG01_NODE_20849_length_932_cov_1.007203_3_plen_105_part_01